MTQSRMVHMLSLEQFLSLFLVFITLLVVTYFVLETIEKAKVKKLTKPKYIYLKTSFLTKYIDRLFEIPFIEKLIKKVSYKISYFNSYDAKVNYRNALLMIISAFIIAVTLFALMVINFGAEIWYMYILYVVMILLLLNIVISFYSDYKEINLAKQLPEALNDLKIAYDTKKRLKLAILHSYEDMPKDIKKEFARLAESDNLEESIIYLRDRVKSQWFKIILTLMLLAVQKGDKEGALSEQFQSLNGIITQEILIKESNRLLFQTYKLFVLAAPAFAWFMKNQNLNISSSFKDYYNTFASHNEFALLLIVCFVGYYVLNTFEKI
jgi:hypothetical protein